MIELVKIRATVQVAIISESNEFVKIRVIRGQIKKFRGQIKKVRGLKKIYHSWAKKYFIRGLGNVEIYMSFR